MKIVRERLDFCEIKRRLYSQRCNRIWQEVVAIFLLF